MGFIKDFLSIFQKRELIFIESRKESEDAYTFSFEKGPDLSWKAGQYGLFSITHKTMKNATKPFSISSVPSENVVNITTRIGDNPSEFKKAMLELKPGMHMKMSGPVGSFHLDPESPSLLIAAGIGMTPFRSILKQTTAGKGELKPIQLLYLDSKKSYLFKDELDAIASHPSIQVSYLDSRTDLDLEIDKFIAQHKGRGKYLVAGPKSMVESVAAYLQSKDVSKQNIKKDAFFGY
ncbi:MAG: FAD-dependent oxidoreductase [Paenibacillus lautus]|jgi:ferredoxin-NADP reductase|uniref:FAD-dependent oxidoreductase n=1 Tax=Paenibacillus lautus TaxID=1401 RepID=UPI0026EBE5B4|nr:FAD-dependent oxidoreductase [Paenibacillus lautus]MCI1773107.1 FAD-dependent oxidoreductase [Paenibacillus lautus]